MFRVIDVETIAGKLRDRVLSVRLFAGLESDITHLDDVTKQRLHEMMKAIRQEKAPEQVESLEQP